MKYSAAIILLVSAIVSVPGQTQDPSVSADAISSNSVPTDPATSREIYDQMCAGCHGFRGDGGEGHRGGFSPHIGTLADVEYMSQVPDEYLVMIIKKGGAFMGKIATMPAWEKRLSHEEVLGLVAHIRTFIKPGGKTAH